MCSRNVSLNQSKNISVFFVLFCLTNSAHVFLLNATILGSNLSEYLEHSTQISQNWWLYFFWVNIRIVNKYILLLCSVVFAWYYFCFVFIFGIKNKNKSASKESSNIGFCITHFFDSNNILSLRPFYDGPINQLIDWW